MSTTREYGPVRLYRVYGGPVRLHRVYGLGHPGGATKKKCETKLEVPKLKPLGNEQAFDRPRKRQEEAKMLPQLHISRVSIGFHSNIDENETTQCPKKVRPSARQRQGPDVLKTSAF